MELILFIFYTGINSFSLLNNKSKITSTRKPLWQSFISKVTENFSLTENFHNEAFFTVELDTHFQPKVSHAKSLRFYLWALLSPS